MKNNDLKDVLKNNREKNCYMACIWSAAEMAKDQKDVVEDRLQQGGQIIASKEVNLTYPGMKNFMAQIYGHQAWTGNIQNHFRGVGGKAAMCFKAGQPVTTYLFTAESLERVLEIKDRIREIFDMGKHSIHISDNQGETECMVELLYHQNSVDFLNCARPYQYSNIFCKLKELKKEIQERGLEREKFVLGGDSLLEVCGMRKAEKPVLWSDYEENEISELLAEGWQYGGHIPDAFNDAENYFYFEGMRFQSVSYLLEEKRVGQEWETTKDIQLLTGFLKRMDEGSKGNPGRVEASITRIRTIILEKIKGFLMKK